MIKNVDPLGSDDLTSVLCACSALISSIGNQSSKFWIQFISELLALNPYQRKDLSVLSIDV